MKSDAFLSDIALLGQTCHILQNAPAIRVEMGQKRGDLVCQFLSRGLFGMCTAPPDTPTYFFEGRNPSAEITLQKFSFAPPVPLQRGEGTLQRLL